MIYIWEQSLLLVMWYANMKNSAMKYESLMICSYVVAVLKWGLQPEATLSTIEALKMQKPFWLIYEEFSARS